MIQMIKNLMIAKRTQLSYIAQEYDKFPSEELKALYDENLQDLKDLTNKFNQELVELIQLTHIEDVIDLYFEDNIDDGRNIEDYHEAFTELQKLHMIIAKQSALYADYIEEELDDFYND